MTKIPEKYRPWVEAKKRHHLSHAHVQMARELGMNPKKLGGLDNHRQEPWKAPLSQFIENCSEKRFGRRAPIQVLSIEELVKAQVRKKEIKKQRKLERRSNAGQATEVSSP